MSTWVKETKMGAEDFPDSSVLVKIDPFGQLMFLLDYGKENQTGWKIEVLSPDEEAKGALHWRSCCYPISYVSLEHALERYREDKECWRQGRPLSMRSEAHQDLVNFLLLMEGERQSRIFTTMLSDGASLYDALKGYQDAISSLEDLLREGFGRDSSS